jgi:peptide chain release factor subunit 3
MAARAKDHLAIVFVGHVDAGKSTTAGHLLCLMGQVDQRTVERCEQEAKAGAGVGYAKAYLMDTNEEERARGKTQEVARAHFATEARRFTILDAPGHRNCARDTIEGVAHADVAVLVVSARTGEFEAGFERDGQTREHALLARASGITRLIVALNKMDDRTVGWSQDRYRAIVRALRPFLVKTVGFADTVFLPMSGASGANLRDPLEGGVAPWYDGPSLVQALDAARLPRRDPHAPFYMTVSSRMTECGRTVIEGKIESGTVRVGDRVTTGRGRGTCSSSSPGLAIGIVQSIGTDFAEALREASVGEIVRIVVAGCDARPGDVLSCADRPLAAVDRFEAHLSVLRLLEHKPILSKGYSAVLHAHTAVAECTVRSILGSIDRATGGVSADRARPLFARAGDLVVVRIEIVGEPVCLATCAELPRLGRFTLRDEGRTVAVGKITRLPEPR